MKLTIPKNGDVKILKKYAFRPVLLDDINEICLKEYYYDYMVFNGGSTFKWEHVVYKSKIHENEKCITFMEDLKEKFEILITWGYYEQMVKKVNNELTDSNGKKLTLPYKATVRAVKKVGIGQ